MFGKLMDRVDGMVLGTKIRTRNAVRKFKEDTEGMETLQVIIIIAIALGVAAAIVAIVNRIQGTSEGKVSDFEATFNQ